ALRVRRLGPPPLDLRPELPQVADRALSEDALRAPALLPVRPRGRLARARVRERVVRRLADDPARRAAGRGAAGGARARAGLEAALRLRRRADAGALLPRREVVVRGARRGARGRPGAGRRGARRADDPARE